jgi:DNA-binding MarR family transcriptional regulator
MVRQGWIERRAGKGDKRSVTVRLTPIGREMAERLSLSSKEYVRKVLKHIPENKVPEVVESLRRVAESIRKEIWEEERR